MKEFWKVVLHHRKQPKTAPVSSVSESNIQGYMFVFQSARSKSLDIQAYLNGGKDEEFQKRASNPMFRITDKIYTTLDALLSDKSRPGEHTKADGSCYVLYLNCPAQAAYELIAKGEFHKAIAEARDFHEVLRQSRNSAHKPTR